MLIDVAVIFPDHLLLHAAIQNADYALAVARSLQTAGWSDEWLDGDNGLKGAIIAARIMIRCLPPKNSASTPHSAMLLASTCRPPVSNRCTATAATIRCTRPRRKRACPSCCTASRRSIRISHSTCTATKRSSCTPAGCMTAVARVAAESG